MKILKVIVVGLLLLVITFAVVGLFLPSSVHVERTVSINRPTILVFDIVNNLRRFNDWSPWYPRDPQAQYRYEGPESGVGAIVHWTGNDKVGSGTQTIVESQPNSAIKVSLEFGPKDKATAFYKLVPDPVGVKITWGFDNDFGYNLIARYFGLMFEKWIGADYEEGLAKLKLLAEKLPNVDYSDAQISIEHVQAKDILFVSDATSKDPEAIGKAISAAYQEIMLNINKNGLSTSGAPIAITSFWDERGYAFDAAIPVNKTDIPLGGRVKAGKSYAGKVVVGVHTGPYPTMAKTYEKLEAYLAVRKWKHKDRYYEEYLNSPADTPPEKLMTKVYFPVE
jgi:effector-binding domain-containing protein